VVRCGALWDGDGKRRMGIEREEEGMERKGREGGRRGGERGGKGE